MPDELRNIHTLFLEKIHARYSLTPVTLKHPFPERPLRALGAIKINGNVYESGSFLRVMVLTTNFFGGSRCSRSIFLGPRPGLYLPIFSSETILMGTKRAFLVDIHATVRQERWREIGLEERMLAVKSRYAQLTLSPLVMKGKINDIMSKAHLYIRIAPEQDAQALGLFNEYLDLFLAMVDAAAPVGEAQTALAAQDFEQYHQTIMNHDPAVKLYSFLFGKRGGPERVNDLFFAR